MRISSVNLYRPFKAQQRQTIPDYEQDELKKLMNSWQYLDLTYSTKTGQFGVYEYGFKNGKKGDVERISDGKLDNKVSDKDFVQTYLDKGYDINKITFNNQPAKDLFIKS